MSYKDKTDSIRLITDHMSKKLRYVKYCKDEEKAKAYLKQLRNYFEWVNDIADRIDEVGDKSGE